MSRPNFRIIESESKDIDYESFKKDYMNPRVSRQEIMEKYGLGEHKYLRQGKRVFEDTGFIRKKGVKPVGAMTNITKLHNGMFRVNKQINKKYIHIGTYESLENAQRVRDYLTDHYWSDDAIKYCKSGRI